jgi:hypothetical protein
MGDRDEGSESIEQSANTWWKKKNITEDQTTANKELAKKREILHLEST